ncbi:hypothetical protein ONA91_19345 [Micromonospora sp. DR5-3]|uniref:DUF7003 family protein n=1 Tax=unclassified Micromonospora TaxID=2617518 RepID=UPI0011D9165C|nr:MULTISPECIES: hypothetical protein [unclassified Micromonospora]MCW3816604.1 hypothetical protein [Micromonospora sp. DR5-3]TYC23049.1 hypothetical protein FXF52_17830 [Micromonospora sp. MP36]
MVDVGAILEQFDAAADEAVFVDLENGYYYPIDSRLHAYRDANRWALVVELVGYNRRAQAVLDVLHVFGNCLTSGEPGFENGDFHSRIEHLEEIVDEQLPPFVLRGHSVPLTTTPGEPMVDALRRLVPTHRNLLLATEDELRARIPNDVPEILRLEEWHQPVFDDVLPSQTETYRLIAEVLTTGDPGRYQPTLPPTTHWSHWPNSGTL